MTTEAPPNNRSELATRLFLGDEGVVLLDPASGTRSVIVRRRDRLED